MIDSEEALYLAKLEIFRLKDLLKRTECERDTVIANAFKRIEQLEDKIMLLKRYGNCESITKKPGNFDGLEDED